MGGFGNLGGSESQTAVNDQRITATDDAVVNANRKSGNVSWRVGKGATVTLTTTDHGAVASANSIVRDTVNSQAHFASDALDQLSKLSETKVTDGANLTNKSVLAGIIAISGVAGLFLLFLFFRKRST